MSSEGALDNGRTPRDRVVKCVWHLLFLSLHLPTSFLISRQSSTVFGLSGVGDTFGTCFGPLSRNRMVGFRLGQVKVIIARVVS